MDEQKRKTLSSVELVCFDFDGVFTDNRVFVSEEGIESVACYRSDGIGLDMLKKAGVGAIILSAEANPVVKVRSAKLGVECFSGCTDKSASLLKLLQDRKIDPIHIAYVGNDLPDIDCMSYVGVSIAVQDAYPEVKKYARFLTERPGRYGAVREVCEWIMEAQVAS